MMNFPLFCVCLSWVQSVDLRTQMNSICLASNNMSDNVTDICHMVDEVNT